MQPVSCALLFFVLVIKPIKKTSCSNFVKKKFLSQIVFLNLKFCSITGNGFIRSIANVIVEISNSIDNFRFHIKRMTNQKKIYIVRHGQTEFNKQSIVQGSGVDTELNEKGKWQAAAFYDYYKNVPFDKIYISSLIRTFQSVNNFISDGIAFEKLSELNEIGWGVFEGKLQDGKQRQHFAELIFEWGKGNFGFSIEGGESILQLMERQKIATQKIFSNPDEKTILICMHGRAMKSLLCILLNKSLSQMEEFEHQNLCLYQLDYDGENFSLVKRNDTEHLNTK